MTERIIDLAEEPALLSVRNSLLVIERGGEPEITAPLEEVAVLCLSHPRVVLTQPVLARLAAVGGMVVVCDTKHMPTAMLLPLEAHVTQAERFQAQAQASEPTRKRLWQSIVQAKIRAQARVLQDLRAHDAGLLELLPKVRSGDPANVEAEASRRYWPLLFRDPRFRRGRYGARQNPLLNYGYAVLRAIIARAICASGLHPGLGLHHHNRYNAFPLVDDLMEPFRPIVDRGVALYCDAHGPQAPLDRDAKAVLIGMLMARLPVRKNSRTLFDIAQRTAASLADVFIGKRRTLLLPDL